MSSDGSYVSTPKHNITVSISKNAQTQEHHGFDSFKMDEDMFVSHFDRNNELLMLLYIEYNNIYNLASYIMNIHMTLHGFLVLLDKKKKNSIKS